MAARAGGLAVLGVALISWGCRPGEMTPTRPVPARVTAGAAEGRAPAVRVGIAVAVDAVTILGPADLNAGPEQRAWVAPGERWTVRAAGSGIEAVASGRRALRADGVLAVVPAAGGLVQADGRAYRGTLLLRAAGGGRVTAVNVVDLEEYLLGVVPHEIGPRPVADLEAVKAQAVAARTYAIGNLGSREALGFDFYATTQDQLYLGAADEDSIATRAVRETRGRIVTWNGLPILAYYSSTCGGRTAAIEESWPWRAPLPYLRSVSDMVPGTNGAYCQTSNRFTWSATWTRQQLLTVLGESLRTWTGGRTGAPAEVQSIDRIHTGPSGRTSLRLAIDGQTHTLRADSVRWIFRTAAGGPILNSSRIDAIDVSRSGARIEGLQIRGGGWGHGVGMCQVGALGRARAGQTYEQILAAYYTDTRITTLY